MNQYTPFRASSIINDGRPRSKVEPEKGLWSSMLDSVASGKKLPEKDLIVLGRSIQGTMR